MADKVSAVNKPGFGKVRCCPFFWTSQAPGGDEPAYLSRYQQRFVCRGGRHSSLLTYDELLACLERNGDRCPTASVTA